MIVTNKGHALDYLGINEGLDKALRFIAGTDFDTLEDGNVLIDGQDVRVNVKHMRTKPQSDAKLEAHDDFADIQMLLEGEETVGWCFRNDSLQVTEAAPERDVWFYDGSWAAIDLKPGHFVIVFPDDVHAPGLCTSAPGDIRKAVFKVRLNG